MGTRIQTGSGPLSCIDFRCVKSSSLDEQHGASRLGQGPDFSIRRGVHLEIRNMRRVVALRCKPSGQCRRQLRIHDEAHQATRNTGWSLCRAANASTAVISPASSSGKSCRMSSRLAPAASRSSTSLTRMRKPRGHGRPPHCYGSTVTRCVSLMPASYPPLAATFAHVSRNPTVRLKTSFSPVLSGSMRK